ncbi:MAG TPA: glutaredoxin family protein [bacterium]|nr:glutaredoxin family protein [bacterium]
MASATIKVYTTDHCPQCQQAKTFLKQNSHAFEEINVSADVAKQQEMIILTGGYRQVPVIVVEANGRQEVIKGFDRPKLEQALQA